MQPVLENLPQFVRQAQQHIAGVARAGARAASRIFSISASLRAGIIGAVMTPVGTPARVSSAIACSRRAGVAARGSIRRASAGSSVVTET